jgi:hypothetical protein
MTTSWCAGSTKPLTSQRDHDCTITVDLRLVGERAHALDQHGIDLSGSSNGRKSLISSNQDELFMGASMFSK